MIVLVGCGKTKAAETRAARDLYLGSLFRASYLYGATEATKAGGIVRIVSAKYGAVRPDKEIEPYDLTLAKLSREERGAWGQRVIAELVAEAEVEGRPRPREVMLLMGATYADPLRAAAEAIGIETTEPLKGLELGARRAELARRLAELRAAREPRPYTPHDEVDPASGCDGPVIPSWAHHRAGDIRTPMICEACGEFLEGSRALVRRVDRLERETDRQSMAARAVKARGGGHVAAEGGALKIHATPRAPPRRRAAAAGEQLDLVIGGDDGKRIRGR